MSAPIAPTASVKERKTSQSASSKIDSIVRQLFVPMLCMPTPDRTSFLAEDNEDQILRQVAQECPSALASESKFMDYMVLLYHKFQRESPGSDNFLQQGLNHVHSSENSIYTTTQVSLNHDCDLTHRSYNQEDTTKYQQ